MSEKQENYLGDGLVDNLSQSYNVAYARVKIRERQNYTARAIKKGQERHQNKMMLKQNSEG